LVVGEFVDEAAEAVSRAVRALHDDRVGVPFELTNAQGALLVTHLLTCR
jgi:hypothetical protein